MALIHAKCTECGATLEIDKEKDAAICPYCGAAFVTEKAINNYNTYVTNNIVIDGENISKLFQISQNETINTLKNKCEMLINQENYDIAEKIAQKIISKYPESPAGYACMIKLYPEYRQLGKEDYEEILQVRLLKMQNHPLYKYYYMLKKCLRTTDEPEYQDVLIKTEKILTDFNKIFEENITNNIKKQKRSLYLFCTLIFSVTVLICFVIGIAIKSSSSTIAVIIIAVLTSALYIFALIYFNLYMRNKVNKIKFELNSLTNDKENT